MLKELVYFIAVDMKYLQLVVTVVLLLEQDKVLMVENIDLMHPLTGDMEDVWASWILFAC